MKKSVFGLILVLISLTLFFDPGLARQNSADISPVRAKAMADSLLRLCEETAPLRVELLSQRLELERLSARPWVSRKKLDQMRKKIMALDSELALQMRNFLDETRRMTVADEQQKIINRMGQGDRGTENAR